MKFKVVKEFNSLSKGNILENSTEDPGIFVFEEETEDKYKYISFSEDVVCELIDEGYLVEVEDDDENEDDAETTIGKAITLIDELIRQYDDDNDTVTEKFVNNEIPYCAKLEADTVHFNLTKVLNKIRSVLVNE